MVRRARIALALATSLVVAGTPGRSVPAAAKAVVPDPVRHPRRVVRTDLHRALGSAKTEAALLAHIESVAHTTAARLAKRTGGDRRAIETALWVQIALNLEAKRALTPVNGHPFPLTAGKIRRTVVDYEAFKLTSYVRSGVFPKRYFGYFDLIWDTAAYEKRLRSVVHRAVAIANGGLAAEGSPLRITDAEVAITFLAEGGAILLREDQARLEHVRPVRDIGLDDIATGFGAEKALVGKLDAALHTGLAGIVVRRDGRAYLSRPFRFDEALLGTTVMWVYEKKRTERLLHAAGRKGLETRSPRDQFILAALVYNSGQLFADDRVHQIRTFSTGRYLYAVSQHNAGSRGVLPVLPPRRALAALLRSGAYPVQPTSWSTVYHVLQRFGAYEAVFRFTRVFDAHGMFRPLH